ncbi:MAG: NAD(P)-dependent oxidoreductase [Bacteroidales bacterium]|nr:NAD(P)-dependent oxidoreductase [Bacteroidales bacterium]
MMRMKIGLLRETKNPPDRRVALPPQQAASLMKKYPNLELVAQPSQIRCFADEEYAHAGVPMQEDLSDCDLLIGIKEVDIKSLIPEKKYLFFAHVAKKQPYNKPLLQAILSKQITLVDYEYLTNLDGQRLIAFGRWAGIVGAYNGLRAWGLKTGRFNLKPAYQCYDRQEMNELLKNLPTGPLRILITGGGRVAQGALETLSLLNIPITDPETYLAKPDLSPAACRIDPWNYARHHDNREFDFKHYISHPQEYVSSFKPYTQSTDLLITAHFWDPAAPRLWELAEMASLDFKIRVVADISCDINGSAPSTVRASSIADPFYDFDRYQLVEKPAFSNANHITVMAVDNLPGELPRDASVDFSNVLIESVLPCILGDDPNRVVDRATIVQSGQLNTPFEYLSNWIV